MVGEKLIIEMGKFTGETGVEVYERLKRKVDDEWNRLQQAQLIRSSNLPSPEAVTEKIVVEALDGFLTELPAKVVLEKKLGHSISPEQWNEVVRMDQDFLLKELRAKCRERGLKHTGDKKELAWRLLVYGA